VAKKKASGPNKSAAIRDYLKTHPDAGPTEVATELKKKNIDVALALVSNVKAAMLGRKKKKKKKKSAKPGPKPGGKTGRVGRPAGASDKVSLSHLIEAQEFAAKVGGVEQAQALLKALGKLS
jgi:CelD/BcsL family acetyltransferase involved in cellulose biosynthesis